MTAEPELLEPLPVDLDGEMVAPVPAAREMLVRDVLPTAEEVIDAVCATIAESQAVRALPPWSQPAPVVAPAATGARVVPANDRAGPRTSHGASFLVGRAGARRCGDREPSPRARGAAPVCVWHLVHARATAEPRPRPAARGRAGVVAAPRALDEAERRAPARRPRRPPVLREWSPRRSTCSPTG